MNLQQDFQNKIAESLFGSDVTEEKVYFLNRFNPKNKTVSIKKIAQLMTDKDSGIHLPVYCEAKINQTNRKVIEAIYKTYAEEMKADGVKTDALLNLKPGGILKEDDELSEPNEERRKKFSPWKEVHNWLWNHKFLNWIDENGWDIFKKKAKMNADWIQFLTEQEMASVRAGTRAIKMPPSSPRKNAPTIPVNQPLWMIVDLAYPNYQLLLLNRSAENKYFFCPSSGFAPNAVIDKPPILLPQKDSLVELYAENQRFTFEKLETEEFLAIVLEQPLKLDWLIPSEDENVPVCNAERLKELFEQLEQQGNWQVFYQSFELVE